MRKRLYLLFLLLSFVFACGYAQTAKIKEMRSKVSDLQKQISRKENILLSSKKDIAGKLKNLDLINAQIRERKELIDMLVSEVKVINGEIDSLKAEIKDKEAKVSTSKEEYASALKRSRRYGKFQDKLLFVVSADNFNAMVRRYRYVREYMQAYRKKGEELKSAVIELEKQKASLDSTLVTKNISLEEQKHQRTAMQLLQEQQKQIVSDLQKQSKKVEKELKAQRKQLAKLNSEIEVAVERAVREQRERERKAAKAKKGAEPAKAVTKKETAKRSTNTKLSSEFAQNKGRLPMPITGPYHVVSTFGPQKGVVKGDVKIDYGGIVIEGERGAKAVCVFDGQVVSVIRQADFAFVLVRHDKYITVYSRLGDIYVKEGDMLKMGDVIATVAEQGGHTCLQFQLRNEITKLNPMQWLRVR